MKRLKFLVFILAITIFSCNSINKPLIPEIGDYDLYEPYDFPLKPGMPEWADLSPSEMPEVLQIPDDILKRLSTRALVETCLNYPMFFLFTASSSNPKDGIWWVMNGFNGFGELFLRQDAFRCLFEKYEPFDLNLVVMEGNLSTKFLYLEILICQDEIIENMNYKERILLLKESYSKYKKMLWGGEKVYGYHSYNFTLYLMATLLVALDEPDIKVEINDNENIKLLLNTMRLPNGTDREIEILVNRIINKRNH